MRLIDADSVISKISHDLIICKKESLEDVERVLTFMAQAIENEPTVDAEPVVRCKDCIYWQDNNGGYPVEDCKWRKDETPDPEDYCSCGDRKQDKEEAKHEERRTEGLAV